MRLVASLLLFAALAAAQEEEIARLKSQHAGERRQAALALARMGPEAVAAVPALLARLDDSNVMVRHAAMLALGGIRDPRGVPPLARLLASPDERTRRIASVSLAEIGAPAVPALRNVLRKSGRHTARLAAAHALAALGEKAVSAVPDLEALLEDDAAAVRVGAARGLLAVMGPHTRALAVVYAALEDPDAAIVGLAITTLGDHGPRDPATANRLAAALPSGQRDLQWLACRALGKLGPAAVPAIPALIDLLKTAPASVRTGASGALGRIGEPALPPLVALLALEEPDLSLNVTHACKSMAAAAQAVLAKHLASENTLVAARAVRVLGDLGKDAKPALPALKRALKHADLRVRGEAARSVWLLEGDAQAVLATLIEVLEEADPKTRREAALTLAGLGREALNAVAALEKAAKDADPAVANAARKALKQIN